MLSAFALFRELTRSSTLRVKLSVPGHPMLITHRRCPGVRGLHSLARKFDSFGVQTAEVRRQGVLSSLQVESAP